MVGTARKNENSAAAVRLSFCDIPPTIEAAERERHLNVKAMDIYAAKSNTDKQKNREPGTSPSGSALIRWMELSLAIEEKQ